MKKVRLSLKRDTVRVLTMQEIARPVGGITSLSVLGCPSAHASHCCVDPTVLCPA